MSKATKELPVGHADAPRFLDEKELAQRLGLSVKFLRRRRELRQPPAYAKFGNRVRYPISSVEAFEASAMDAGCSEDMFFTRRTR